MYDEANVATPDRSRTGDGQTVVQTTADGEIIVPEWGGASPAAVEIAPAAGSAASGDAGGIQGSGFGLCHKFAFGSILCGMFSSSITTGALRDVYAIKFHIGIGTMGTIQSLQTILAIFIDVAVGHMQDNEWLVFRLFNKEKWGRRAPWVVLATPVMAVMSAPA